MISVFNGGYSVLSPSTACRNVGFHAEGESYTVHLVRGTCFPPWLGARGGCQTGVPPRSPPEETGFSVILGFSFTTLISGVLGFYFGRH